MARSVVLFRSSSLLILVMFVCFFCSSVVGLGGSKVGGRTEIKDVKKNKEVQELGRFSVQEFNRNQQKKGSSDGALVFSEVVEAQKQVVSGEKYYLKISAKQKGKAKVFDAVVVVKPWISSKELLTFSPSTN